MNVSYRWIRDMVPGLEMSPQQLADRLAMLGAPVDEVTDIGGPLKDVIIGRVERAERHPNADRLSLCTVDAGSGEMRQVVCGAPNVKAGAYYPFAPVGAQLPGGITLRRAKIRGVESEGMLCSARELNLGREHEGILELHGEFEPGAAFVGAVGIDDARLVVDVTPNRPDLLSHVGLAREIAAATGLDMQLARLPGAAAAPAIEAENDAASASAAGVQIQIDDADLCSQYIGVVLRGVRVGPSPEWLASRLRAIGLRPISNVVDATNWVLHELGQPLHAFDLDRLGTQVRIRRARSGERITTLDHVERSLDEGMLVIADGARPVAVAGVMGGADTEVHGGTRDVLLECALFDPKSVRATRRALCLSTDASYRFERGVDPAGLRAAAERAAALIVAVAGGDIEGAAWARPAASAATTVRLRRSRVEQVLGERFTIDQVRELLAPLGFEAAHEPDEDAIELRVPGHRSYDIAREEDLIEEIARRHGYDAFADELRPFRPSVVPSHPLFALEDRLRELLVARGLLEAHTAAFAPETDGDVALMLPLAATESRLRRALLPGLLRRVDYNYARGARSIRMFEIGTAFAAADDGELPHETTRLGVVLTGHRHPPHWTQADTAAFDVWDVKALAAELARILGLRVEERAAHPLLEDALSFTLFTAATGVAVGVAGRVREGAVDSPAWAEPVWAVEVELREEMAPPRGRYAALPVHPAIEWDLALLVPDALSGAAVLDAIRGQAGALLEAAEPFDVYAGPGVPEGTRSVAVRLRFRAPDRTLTDREVADAVKRVLRRLTEDLGVQQRA
jgi:phenylalanyl-tRNA synthetase beta chain